MRRAALVVTLILTVCPEATRAADPLASRPTEPIRLNQIQVIGTHNSYHLAPVPSVLGLIGPKGPELGRSLDYSHRPLGEQLDRLGIRQVELDLYADVQGGHYARPGARRVLQGIGRDPGPDPNEGGRLLPPGPKIFHIQDIDFRSTVATLTEALGQIRTWSAQHPDHVPILVQFELKDEAVLGLPTRPEPFGRNGLDDLDRAIRAAFPPQAILTPDDVRGNAPTLRDAIRTHGWPTLDASRGRVLFALDVDAATRDLYLADHPNLQGRVMFVSSPDDHPIGVFQIVNDPVRDFDEIQRLVRGGVLVRTRADADTVAARRNDTHQRDRALASGAQFVSTDFPEPRPEFSPYFVQLPGRGVARPNPVVGPTLAEGTNLEAKPTESSTSGSRKPSERGETCERGGQCR